MRISDWSSDVCSSDLEHDRNLMGTRQDRDCCCPCLVLFLSCTTRSNLSRSRLAHAPFHLPAPVTSSTAAAAAHVARSEESRVGKECVSTCRSRWSPYP